MDFFKGIGDWFSGLFGQKKKREQPQSAVQPVNTSKPSAVSFNQSQPRQYGISAGVDRLARPPEPFKPDQPRQQAFKPLEAAKTMQLTQPQLKTPPIQPQPKAPPVQTQPKVANPYSSGRARAEAEARQRLANFGQKRDERNRVTRLAKPGDNKPNFLDFLNPLGEHGLFGIKQQQRFNRATKPATDALEKYHQQVDKQDSRPGFQWDDPGDYLRFAQKLPSGMVSGVLEAPNKVAAGVSGKYVDSGGKVSDKNLIQRAGLLGDGYISTAGLAMGASGKLLGSLGVNLSKQTTKQATKTGFKQGFKEFGKGVASEGLEEATQSLLGEIGERGHFDEHSLNRALEAGSLGMLGGAMMGGAGKVVDGVRNAYAKTKKQTPKGAPYASDRDFAGRDFRGENGAVNKIAKDSRGLYVKGENLAGFDEISNRNLPRAAKAYLEGIRNNLLAETEIGKVGIHKDFPGKFAYSNPKMKNIANNKLRMAPQIDELLEVVRWNRDANGNLIEVKNQIGKHPDIESWNYGNVRYEAPDPSSTQYEGVVNVGIGKNGDKNFYSITDIEQKKRAAIPNERVEFELPPNNLNIAQTDQNVNGDIRYKAQQATNHLTATLDELKARHLSLTGDEELVFNVYRNEIEKQASGYFDPKTGTINLNQLTADVLNHEIGHKIFSRVDAKQKTELLNEIKNTYGAEDLLNRYDKIYAEQTKNMTLEQKLDLFAEERLADGFSEYFDGRINGEDGVRLGQKLGIPPKVLAYYDRLVEAIKSVFGKTNELRKFYAEIETGKFRQAPADGSFSDLQPTENPAYKIYNTPDGKVVEIEGNPLKGVAAKDIRNAIKKVIAERFQGSSYNIADTGSKANVTARSKNEIAHKQPSMRLPEYVQKGNMAHNLDELLESMKNIHEAPNLKPDQKPNVAKYIYGDVDVLIGGELYTARVNIEQNTNGQNILYDISRIQKGGRHNLAAKLSEGALPPNGSNISHQDENVKYKQKLKVRRFVKNVMKNDPNPPAEFVESIKGKNYSPRKNAELWRKAVEDVARDPVKAYGDVQTLDTDKAVARGIALAQYYKMHNMDAEASALYIDLAKKATEAGRQVQAFSLMRKSTPEGMMLSLQREIEQYNHKMEKEGKLNKIIKVDKQKVAQQFENLKKAYNMPNKTDTEQRLRKITISRAVDDIRAEIPSSKADKALTLWKAGLLTAPTTHMRNLVGNAVNGLSEWGAGLTGSVVDAGVGLMTGRRGVRANLGGGYLRGVGKGLKTAKDIMLTGVDTSSNEAALGKFQDKKVHFNKGMLGGLGKFYTEGIFRALTAADKPFRQGAYEASITNQAKVIAKNEGLKGKEKTARISKLVANPTVKMDEAANYDADMATFQQQTVLGDMARNAKKGKAGKALDFIMPFTQVPSGVGSQLMNYSPVGIVRGLMQFGDLVKAGKSGSLDEATATILQRKASIQTGRGINGTLLLGAGAYLASQGLLVGEPRSKEEKRQWEAEGKKANSLRFGDIYIPLDKISPQMIALTAGARAQNEIREGTKTHDATLNMFGGLLKSWSEQGYLTGISDAIDTIKGDMKFERWIGNQIGSMNPNIIKKVAAAIDGSTRETNSTVDTLKSGIPGLRQHLPKKYDIYGQEVKNNPAAIMFDPVGVSVERPSELSNRLNYIRRQDKEYDSIIPNKAPKSITIDGKTRNLTAQEESDYQRMMGELTSLYMKELTDSEHFRNANQADKVDLLEKVKKDVKAATEMKLFNKATKQSSDNAKAIAQNAAGNNEISPDWRTKQQKASDLYERPDAEYEQMKQDYDEAVKEGKFKTKLAKIQAKNKLKRAEVGKSTPKEFREAYKASKTSVWEILEQIKDTNERNTYIKAIVEYGDKLVEVGLEERNKFRDKYGNINFATKKESGGKSRKPKAVSSGSLANHNVRSLLEGTKRSQKRYTTGKRISLRRSSKPIRTKSAVRF